MPIEPIPTIPELLASPKEKKPRKKKATLKEDVSAPPQRPSTEAFLDHFFAFAGGPASVAKMLLTEFHNAPQGSLIRQRILELVMRSMGKADAKGSPLDDVSALSDADLMLEIERQNRAMASYYASPPNEPGCPPAGTGPAPGNPAPPGPGPNAGAGGDCPAAGPAEPPPPAAPAD